MELQLFLEEKNVCFKVHILVHSIIKKLVLCLFKYIVDNNVIMYIRCIPVVTFDLPKLIIPKKAVLYYVGSNSVVFKTYYS